MRVVSNGLLSGSVDTQTPNSPESAGVIPSGISPATGTSLWNPTNLPSRTLADTSLATFSEEILMPFLTAKVSTENFPLRSVAVVTIDSAPVPSAILCVSWLQPPMWPERRAMAHLPCSSMHTTAGSESLLFTNGAMCLTAIPVAPMKTMASHSENALLVQSRTLPSTLSMPRQSEEVLQ